MAKFAAILSTVEAGVISVTWSDCGDSDTHVKILDLQPTSIETGTSAEVIGTGTLDEDITGGTFSAVVKADGVTVVSCNGDASEDIVCKLPLGVGSISVKALPFPMSAGTTSITAEVQTISLIPAKLAVTTSHVEAISDTGDKLACLDLNTNAGAELTGMPDCSSASCPAVCTCVESNCASLYDGCVADTQCNGILDCMLGCACDDTTCALGCVAGQTLDSISAEVKTCGGGCLSTEVDVKTNAVAESNGMPDCSSASCPAVCTCVESNCASLYDGCVADTQCNGILDCMLGCACDDTTCALGCVAGQTLDSVSADVKACGGGCLSTVV